MKPTKKQTPYVLTPEDFLSRKERHTLIKTCKEHSDLDLMNGRMIWPVRWMLIDLALYSGLRVSEIASLKIRDIKTQEPDPHLIVRHGKGNRKRTVYLDEKLSKHLQWFIDYKRKTLHQSTLPEDPLFAGRKGDHSPPITLMKSFKQAIKAAGLREELSIHRCRHTYATFLLHDTGNLRYVQQQLGHSDISITSLYADILPEENGKLANKIVRDE